MNKVLVSTNFASGDDSDKGDKISYFMTGIATQKAINHVINESIDIIQNQYNQHGNLGDQSLAIILSEELRGIWNENIRILDRVPLPSAASTAPNTLVTTTAIDDTSRSWSNRIQLPKVGKIYNHFEGLPKKQMTKPLLPSEKSSNTVSSTLTSSTSSQGVGVETYFAFKHQTDDSEDAHFKSLQAISYSLPSDEMIGTEQQLQAQRPGDRIHTQQDQQLVEHLLEKGLPLYGALAEVYVTQKLQPHRTGSWEKARVATVPVLVGCKNGVRLRFKDGHVINHAYPHRDIRIVVGVATPDMLYRNTNNNYANDHVNSATVYQDNIEVTDNDRESSALRALLSMDNVDEGDDSSNGGGNVNDDEILNLTYFSCIDTIMRDTDGYIGISTEDATMQQEDGSVTNALTTRLSNAGGRYTDYDDCSDDDEAGQEPNDDRSALFLSHVQDNESYLYRLQHSYRLGTSIDSDAEYEETSEQMYHRVTITTKTSVHRLVGNKRVIDDVYSDEDVFLTASDLPASNDESCRDATILATLDKVVRRTDKQWEFRLKNVYMKLKGHDTIAGSCKLRLESSSLHSFHP